MPDTPTPEAARELLCEVCDIISEPVDTGRTRRSLRSCIPFLNTYAELHDRLAKAQAECGASHCLLNYLCDCDERSHYDKEWQLKYDDAYRRWEAATEANPMPEDKPDACGVPLPGGEGEG